MPKERYINREQLRMLIQTSDMTLWRWQRGPKSFSLVGRHAEHHSSRSIEAHADKVEGALGPNDDCAPPE